MLMAELTLQHGYPGHQAGALCYILSSHVFAKLKLGEGEGAGEGEGEGASELFK